MAFPQLVLIYREKIWGEVASEIEKTNALSSLPLSWSSAV
jgi:hypothetical protein